MKYDLMINKDTLDKGNPTITEKFTSTTELAIFLAEMCDGVSVSKKSPKLSINVYRLFNGEISPALSDEKDVIDFCLDKYAGSLKLNGTDGAFFNKDFTGRVHWEGDVTPPALRKVDYEKAVKGRDNPGMEN